MNDPDKNVVSELLASAKRAFLEEGFEGAALRKICSDAGVTTGAVYFFFHSKEELFDALVKSTVEETKRLCDKLAADELETLSLGVENDKKLITFLYTRREEIRLLTEKSKGTKYEHYKDDLLQWLQNAFLRFFEAYYTGEIDHELIRILAEMRLKSYLEIINGEYDMKRMLDLSEKIGLYADGGFSRLLQTNNLMAKSRC
ncbi:MAG: TetR/AcrR family transcriptional regulator [Lachnospiraceae bacterium]|nr:TetR/AcrR family transcriptional regulator [Lachnospiraceae bacterium]